MPPVLLTPELLGRLVPFQDCTPEQLEEVRRRARPIQVPAGTPVLAAGQGGGPLIVVIDGALRVRRADGLDGILGAGDVVGEMAALAGEPASADVVAVEPSTLLVIDPREVPALLAIAPIRERIRALARARTIIGGRGLVEAASVPVVTPPPTVRGVGAGLYARRDLPVRPIRVALLAVLAFGLAAGVWTATERNRATVPDLDELLAEVRGDEAVAGDGVQPPGPNSDGVEGTSAPDGIPTAEPTEAVVAQPDPVTPGDGSGILSPEPAASTEPDVEPDSTGFVLPTSGVYTYATTGGERISMLGASHQYPDETHMIVRHAGCGWEAEHHILAEHVDTMHRCTEPDLISMALYRTDVEFFGQRDGLTYRCDPTAPLLWVTPPQQRASTCRSDEGDEMHLVVTQAPDEEIEVGGQRVTARRGTMDVTMSGKASGTSRTEVWLHPRTGLLLRAERTVRTQAKAVWGTVAYEEDATFHLASLTPRT